MLEQQAILNHSVMDETYSETLRRDPLRMSLSESGLDGISID